MDIIHHISALLDMGVAYIIQEDGWVYICFDYVGLLSKYRILAMTYARLCPPPVQYPVVLLRHPKDCVIWAPYVDGFESPWGRGCATVNYDYVMDNIMRS